MVLKSGKQSVFHHKSNSSGLYLKKLQTIGEKVVVTYSIYFIMVCIIHKSNLVFFLFEFIGKDVMPDMKAS